MARRLFNGRQFSENGWPYVDQGSCRWVKIAENASIEIQDGVPAAVMGAFARDFDAYVQPIFDADSACWTEGNKVATSNHPGGTAMDLRWDSHPVEVRNAGFSPEQVATCRELLEFYEGLIYWGNDWNSFIDSMHWQMGYDTYDQGADRPYQKCFDFTARKIRADGFSTFRRGNTVELSKKDRYALAVIEEGRRQGITDKGIKIALSVTLVETNLTMYANSNVAESLNYPHDAVGSDHDSTGLFQQRQAWGPLSSTMDPTKSAGLFFLGGNAGQRGLTDFDYNSDARTPGGWAQAVQVSAFPDRYDERFGEAEQIYNRLINLGETDDMANVPQDQWDWVYNELKKTFASRSMYATSDDEDTFAGRAVSAHAFAWDDRVESSALRGEQWAIAAVAKAAAGSDEFLSNHAKAVLADIETKNPAALQQFLNGAN